jgi:cell wall assembly regulator SMI1
LRLPFVAGLLVLCLFDLFREVTFTIAMQPGFVPVFAKLGGNVIPVQLKPRENEKAREVDRDQRKDE